MIDNDKIKSRRIRELLYLEKCLIDAIHQEIGYTLRNRPEDIIVVIAVLNNSIMKTIGVIGVILNSR